VKARAAAAEAREQLEAAGIQDAAMEAEVLTRHASGLSRSAYFADESVDEASQERLVELVARRLQREPTPYLTGLREFRGLDFTVGPGALIPRPETELLVELGLAELERAPESVVVDMGTGCGNIAIALAMAAPGARIVATDFSADALRLAATNVARHGAAVELVRADLGHALARADVILSNLPYVPTGVIPELQPEVRGWEPHVALDGGEDGLDLVRAVLDDCAARLRPRLVAFELGLGQARKLAEYVTRLGGEAGIEHDLVGWERVVTARWR